MLGDNQYEWKKHPGVPGIDYWNSFRSKHEESRQRCHLWHLCFVCCFFSFRCVISFTIFLTPAWSPLSPGKKPFLLEARGGGCRLGLFADHRIFSKRTNLWTSKVPIAVEKNGCWLWTRLFSAKIKPESSFFLLGHDHIYQVLVVNWNDKIQPPTQEVVLAETRKKKGGTERTSQVFSFGKLATSIVICICIYNENDGFLWS